MNVKVATLCKKFTTSFLLAATVVIVNPGNTNLQANSFDDDPPVFQFEHILRMFSRMANADQASDCSQRGAVVGEQFQTMSTYKVLSTYCEHDSIHTGYGSLVIRYEAPAPVQINSTNQIETIGVEKAMYSKQEDCLKNLDANKETFRSQTELEPFVSYCFPTRSHLSGGNRYWAYRFDAIGIGKRRFHLYNFDAYTSQSPCLEGICKDIVNHYFNDESSTLAHLVIHRNIGWYEPTVYAYSETAKIADSDHDTRFENLEACQQTSPKIKAHFQKNATKILSVFCQKPTSSVELNFVWVNTFADSGKKPFSKYPMNGFYTSRTLCEKEIPPTEVSEPKRFVFCGYDKSTSSFQRIAVDLK